ncbi:hemerythrin domain-containing protein [Pseudomonas sp. JS3066]|jgi:hemerythrin-like domain-containing protein|uniref:hemerythrin domain-containing protein n=1 Tax=unclassified Pseudomonas TaxID=196821 RepID=UPI000EA96D47|nr:MULTISPECIES: hemerythrin domain-containing protein [unclassified Pseudomonas]AYF86760.1 hemerythrin domain-containing protein [Pseudomonas sp. DY-1]MDH4653663.1 hemerythrin domain-containing protein [Pseudomonas sp. BN606]MRK21990.1 hemerythrin domain-containing protein [Pseudomonas sp. JG-B]WVK95768.1 hemerythrin domain-containing protein [Pseudomonas sp. JS3066]
MNAITLLKQDHAVVRQLLEKLSATTERGVKTRMELLNRISGELAVHTEIEERIFYPAYVKAGGKEEQKMFYEAMEEHRTVDSLVLPDLLKTPADSVQFSGRIKVLKELLEHHLQEEEQDMFPNAAKLLKKSELEELGKHMENRKRELKQSLDHAA